MTRWIDADDVRDTIPGVIAIKGEDYQYEMIDHQCLYWDDKNQRPSCLVGYYLIDVLGIPAETFRYARNWAEFDQLVDMNVFEDYAFFSPEAVEVLTELQQYQDGGKTWGEAYECVFGPKEDN